MAKKRRNTKSTKSTNKKVNSLVQTNRLSSLDNLNGLRLSSLNTLGRKNNKLISKLNPAKIDDIRNDVKSRIHKVNPVSIIKEKRRNELSNLVNNYLNTKHINQHVAHKQLLKSIICANRKVRKEVMIAKRQSGKGTPKTYNILSNVKC